MRTRLTTLTTLRITGLFMAAAASALLSGAEASNAPACVDVNYVPTTLPENATPPWTQQGNTTNVCCVDPAMYGQTCDPTNMQCVQLVNGELELIKSGDRPPGPSDQDHNIFYVRQDCSIGNSTSASLTSKVRLHPDVPSPDNNYSPTCNGGVPPDATGPGDTANFYADTGDLAVADGTKAAVLTLGVIDDPRFGPPGAPPTNTFIGVPNFGNCTARSEAANFVAYAPIDITVPHTYNLVLRPGIDFNVYVDGAAVPTLTVPYASLPSAAVIGGLQAFAFVVDRGIGYFDFVDTAVCGGSCGGGGGPPNCGTGGTAPPATLDAHGNCTGTVANATVNGNITVPNGATCALVDVLVNGNVTSGSGSNLTIQGGAVQGNVQAQGSASLTLGADACGGGPTIKNDVQANTTTTVSVAGAAIGGNLQCSHGGSVTVSGTSVHNDVQVQQNTGPVGVSGGTIGGNLQLQQNGPDATTCSGNHVGKNLQIQQNTGGVSVTGNTWGGNLQCQGDQPPATGQCTN